MGRASLASTVKTRKSDLTIKLQHITALENVQHRATKLIPGYKELDYKERLKSLNLPTLSYRCLRGDMIEIYKILTGNYDSTVTSNFFTLRENYSITRKDI